MHRLGVVGDEAWPDRGYARRRNGHLVPQHRPGCLYSDGHTESRCRFAWAADRNRHRWEDALVRREVRCRCWGDRLAISILGGITKKVGGLSLSFPCGMSATPLFVGKPQPTYPANPLVGLVPYLRLPATIKAGSTLHFEVDLSNPGDRPVVLSPCPVYLEHSDIPTKLLYRLDCRTVRSIPAHGQVRYEMEMAIPDAAPLGPAEVFWGLVGASTTTAQGQVLVQ